MPMFPMAENEKKYGELILSGENYEYQLISDPNYKSFSEAKAMCQSLNRR